MGVSLGIGALAEGAGAAEAFALPAEITAGVEAGIADAGLGTLAADAAGAGLASDVAAGGLGDLAAGSTAAELLAAGVPELAAPVEAGAAAAGSLAPAAGALAPVAAEASPAIAGLGSAVSEAVPGALAEGAGVAPLTETAVETAAAAPGVAAPAADALATPLTTETAAQGAAQAATQGVTQTAETGLSQLAPGAQQALSDAAPLSTSAGSQLAQAVPESITAPASTSLSTPAITENAVANAPTLGQTATANLAPGQTLTSSLAPQAALTPGPESSYLASSTTTPAAVSTLTPEAASAGPGVEGYTTADLAGPPGSPAVGDKLLNAGLDANAAAGGEGLTGSASNLAGKAGDYLAKNPTSILSALGMLANLAKGNQPPKFSAELQAQAAALQAQGAQLQGYLTSGTLPPGIGSALSGAHDSASAAIRSRYANMGMSGSSAEMQDLNNLAQTTVSQGADIANKLLATGVSEQQFASGLYQNLMATAMAQDTNMSNAISGFTNAMAKASAVG